MVPIWSAVTSILPGRFTLRSARAKNRSGDPGCGSVPDVLRGILLVMNRRKLLTMGAAGLGIAARGFAQDKPRRVGLIGCGWYGKADLLRLIQVAPVEVVSLCDVDRHMLAEAADIVATRQASKKKPRTFTDYREMLQQKDLDIVEVATPDHWHALPMIAAVASRVDVWVQKPIRVS